MPTPSVQDLKGRFEIAAQIADSRIEFAIETALSDIEDTIGIDAYNEVFEGVTSTVEDDELDTDTTTTNENARRVKKVTNAVYYKAFAKLLRNANTRIRPHGSVKREQDASSPAMSGGKQTDNEYLTPDEVSTMADWYESEAGSLLSPYVLPDTTNTAIEFVLSR